MATFNRNTELWCACCGKAKPKQNFLNSLNPEHNGKFPYCKSCINNKFKKYQEKLKSDEGALWCLCAELGYPVMREPYELTLKELAGNEELLKKNNLFWHYHNTLKEIGFIIEGFWQSDIMLTDFIKTGEEHEEKEPTVSLEELKENWGNYDSEDYDLLEKFFNMYTEDIETMDTAMELRYRDLCKAELRKRKADENGDITEISKAEDSLRKNMALLHLDKFQSNQQSDIEKHIERMAWMVENTKPCECRELDKYKDFSNFGIKWDEILRPIKNILAGTRDFPDIPKDEQL